jgi:cytochrome P450
VTALQQEACPYPFRDGDEQRLDIDPEIPELHSKKSLVRISCSYGGDAWLAVGHEDAKFVMSDLRFGRSLTLGRNTPRISPRIAEASGIITTDQPEHSRLRKLMSPAFTTRRLEALRPRVQQITDECLDRIEEMGPPVSLIEELAMPVPVAVISYMLGVPFEDHPQFRQWSDRMMLSSPDSLDDAKAASIGLIRYMYALVKQRRTTPSDDLLGVLVAARDQGDRLSEQELVVNGMTLLVAGHESTSRMITNVVYNLLTHQDQLDKLRADPGLLDSAIEELLRFTPLHASASASPWIAIEDVQVGNVLVRKGESVLVEMGAANRDEEVFDRPDELDLTRTRESSPHLTLVMVCISVWPHSWPDLS